MRLEERHQIRVSSLKPQASSLKPLLHCLRCIDVVSGFATGAFTGNGPLVFSPGCFTRSAMIEVMGQHYIRTASAKGLKWHDVVWGHALPNAAIPIVTIVGFMVGSLIAGAVVVESIFSWPGIGRLLVVSVTNRDLAVVQCILLIIAAAMVVSNLIVDLLYGWLDPRLRMRASH